MGNIQYGVIREIKGGTVIVSVNNEVKQIPVTIETEQFIAAALVEGSRIVVVDLDNNSLVFDEQMNEQHFPHLVDAHEPFEEI